MTDSFTVLLGTAALVGFVHALVGPDHYLPFVAMARAGGWPLRNTLLVTSACGLAHVLASVCVGALGLWLGATVLNIGDLEAFRGDLASWALIAFGLLYAVWGVRRAIRNRPHAHVHVHADGTIHSHRHVHDHDHVHVHDSPTSSGCAQARSLTPWVLFVVFLFGPCEPLIPLLMYGAANGGGVGMGLVAGVFALTTVGTMLVVVTAALRLTGALPLSGLYRFGQATAGLVVLGCGVAMKFGL